MGKYKLSKGCKQRIQKIEIKLCEVVSNAFQSLRLRIFFRFMTRLVIQGKYHKQKGKQRGEKEGKRKRII